MNWFKPRTYIYHVSYFGAGKNGDYLVGRANMALSTPIKDGKVLSDIEQSLFDDSYMTKPPCLIAFHYLGRGARS